MNTKSACYKDLRVQVNTSYCNPRSRPATGLMPCNTQPCPTRSDPLLFPMSALYWHVWRIIVAHSYLYSYSSITVILVILKRLSCRNISKLFKTFFLHRGYKCATISFTPVLSPWSAPLEHWCLFFLSLILKALCWHSCPPRDKL